MAGASASASVSASASASASLGVSASGGSATGNARVSSVSGVSGSGVSTAGGVSTSGVDWCARLRGFVTLVPGVCALMSTYHTRVLLGAAVVAVLLSEYYDVTLSNHSNSNSNSNSDIYNDNNNTLTNAANAAAGGNKSVSNATRWSFERSERVLAIVLGIACFVAAHFGTHALSAAFYSTILVRS